MPTDIKTTDIRSDIKAASKATRNPLRLVGRYAKGTAQLFGASTLEYFQGALPAPIAMAETNAPLMQDIVRTLRNPAATISRTLNKALKTESYQSGKKFVQYLLDDLKTGNLYDKNRDRSESAMQFEEELNSFGDFDLSGFDANGDWSEDNISNTGSNTDIEIAKMQEDNAEKRTELMTEVIGSATEAIIRNDNANANNALKMDIKAHGQTLNALQNNMEINKAIHTVVSHGFSEHLKAMNAAHTDIMGKLTSIETALNKIDTTLNPPPAQKKPRKEDIFGINGEVNIKEFFKRVASNINDKYSITSMLSMLTGGMSIGTIADTVVSNPLQLVTDLIVNKIIPKEFKTRIAKTNKNFETFFPALLASFKNRNDKAKNKPQEASLLDNILGELFFKPRSSSTINTIREDTLKKVNFTGKTARAIEEVIPTLLAKIDSHISGEELQVFDYRTGNFVKANATIAKYSKNARDLVKRSGDAGAYLMNRAKAYKFKKPKDAQEFQDYMYQYIQRMAEEGNLINPYMSSEEFKRTMPDHVNKNQYYNLIMGILNTMNKEDLMSLSSNLRNARVRRNNDNENINRELIESGLGILFSEGTVDTKFKNSIINKANSKYDDLSVIDLDKLASEHNKSKLIKTGSLGTNVILDHILNRLESGIITYTYLSGSTTNSAVSAGFNEAKDAQSKAMKLKKQRYDAANALQIRVREAEDRREHENNEAANRDFIDLPNMRNAFVGKDIDLMTAQEIQAAINIAEKTDDDINNKFTRDQLKAIRRRQQNADGSRTEFGNNLINSASDKIRGISGKVNGKGQKFFEDLFNKPFKRLTKALDFADKAMFTIIYGSEGLENIDENSSEPYLLQTITNTVKTYFAKARDWFSEKIIDPIHDKLFSKENGIFPKIKEQAIEFFKTTVGYDEKKQKVKDKFNELKERFIGKKGEDGIYSGGRFSNQLNALSNKNTTIKDKISTAFDKLLYGDYVKEPRKGVKIDPNDPNNKKYGGVIGKFKKAFDATDNFFFGDEDSRKKWRLVKSELGKAFPDMVVSGGVGLLASFFLPGGPLLGTLLGATAGLVKGSSAFSKFLFGEFGEEEDVLDENGNVKLDWKGRKMKRRRHKGGGLISPEVYEGLKKYAPKVLGGAAIGAVASGFLPFAVSPLVGNLIGALGGMGAASDEFKQLLFGNSLDPKSGLISKEFRDKLKNGIKEHAPATIAGFLGGKGILSLMGKVGIIPGTLLGTVIPALGAVTGFANAKSINKLLFGEEAEETVTETRDGKEVKVTKKVRKGGLFGKIFDVTKNSIITPIAKKFDAVGKSIGKWFHESIIKPFSTALTPLKEELKKAGGKIKEAFKTIGEKITESLKHVFHISVGKPLGDFFREKILDPLKKTADKIFSTIGKVLGSILSAPFKALQYIIAGKPDSDDDVDEKNDRWWKNRDKKFKERRAGKRRGLRDIINDNFRIFKDRMERSKTNKANNKSKTRSGINDAETVIHLGGEQLYQDENGRWRDAKGKFVKAPEWLKEDLKEKGLYKNRKKSDKSKKEKTSKTDRSEDLNDSNIKNNAAKDEADKTNRKLGKSKTNNQYLKDIANYTRKIYTEVNGQVNGVGWNTGYIRTLLAKQFGPLSDDELPEEMEGSRKIKKRRTVFGRLFDTVKNKVGGAASGLFSGIRDFFSGDGIGGKVLHAIMHPLKALKDLMGGLLTGAKNLLKFFAETGKEMFKGLFDGLGSVFRGFGDVVKGIGEGLGASIKNALLAVTDAVTMFTGALAATVRTAFDVLSDVLPDLAHMGFNAIVGVGRTLWKGAKKVGRGVTRGVKNFFANRRAKKFAKAGGDPTTIFKKKYLGAFEIAGGSLDEIKDPVEISVSNGRVFPLVNVIRGHLIDLPKTAVPVYVLGGIINSSSGSNDIDMDTFRNIYNGIDTKAENSVNPGEYYDKAIRNAKSGEEVKAIQLAQQLNNNNQALVPVTSTGSGEQGSSFLDQLFGLAGAGQGNGVIGNILRATNLFRTTRSGGAGLLGTIASGMLLPAIGTGVGVMTGTEDRKVTGSIKMASRGIGSLLTSPKYGAIIADKSHNLGLKLLGAGADAAEGTVAHKGLMSRIISKIVSMAQNALKNSIVGKLLGKAKASKLGRVLSNFKAKLGEKLALTTTATLQNIAKKIGIITTVATAVYDFISGYNEAAYILEIDATDVTTGMKIACAVSKCLSGLAFGLIPVSWLSEMCYKLFASDEDDAKLDRAKEEFKMRAAESGMSVEDFNSQNNKTVWQKIKDGVKSAWNWLTGASGDNAKEGAHGRFGRGIVTPFSQTDSRWNAKVNDLAYNGCGPTAAAMVASAYGKNANPAEADLLSKAMYGMRDSDGGTNPAFFSKYAAGKGYGMAEGPTSPTLISNNLSKGNPVVLMGRGGAFGSNTHYLVADGISNKGSVNIVDPVGGMRKTTSMRNLMKNTTNTIYSRGKGRGRGRKSYGRGRYNIAGQKMSTQEAQQALVDKMKSIEGKLAYSTAWDQQDPGMGVASCASTVGWVYKQVLGVDGMSASSTTQSKDSRFSTIFTKISPNGLVDTSTLQPGDILYYKWGDGTNVYDGDLDHTEMYIGGGKTMSHGGGDDGTVKGPVKKDLNFWRLSRLMMVRRYKPFCSGRSVDIFNVAPNMNSDGNEPTYTPLRAEMTQDGIIKTNIYDVYQNGLSKVVSSFDDALGLMLGNVPDSESDEPDDTKYTKTNSANVSFDSNDEQERMKHIVKMLSEKNLDHSAISAIMGNLYAESGLNPGNLQNTFESSLGTDKAYTDKLNAKRYSKRDFSSDGAGYGLAQWTFSSRKENLYDRTISQGKKIDDIDAQLNFLYDEMVQSGILDRINNRPDLAENTKDFMLNFERPQDQSIEAIHQRQQYAKDFMNNRFIWGKGPMTNLDTIRNKVNSINSAIRSSRQRASEDTTAAAITKQITNVINNTSGSGGSKDTLDAIAKAMASMITYLAQIADNTAKPQVVVSSPDKLKTANANNFSASPTGGSASSDVGSKVVDALTRR